MRLGILLVFALLLGEENPDLIPAASVSEKYSAICADYNRAMVDARAKNAPHAELRYIGRSREEALRSLIAAALSRADIMVAADWSAMAMAAEFLFRRDECIRYASRAIELDPKAKEAYVPLIRSLSNANRLDDAEVALASAEKQFNDGSKWHGLHYAIFLKRRKEQEWLKAAIHLRTVLEAMLSKGGNNAAEARSAARYISQYPPVAEQADLEEDSRRQLQEWLRACEDALGQKLSDESIGVSELLHSAALCEVQCEIAKCSPELVYDDYLLRMAKVVYDPRWVLDVKVWRSQQAYFGKYLQANTGHVKSWGNVAAGLSRLLKERFPSETEKADEVSKSILTKLHAFAESRVAREAASESDVK